MFNDFTQLVLNRQSCRNFNDKPLQKETIEKIVDLAINTPSACNSQPWKMYVVTDETKRKQVAESIQFMSVNKFVDDAKAFIVLAEKDAVLKPSASSRFDSKHFVKYDIGELIAYITLGAQSLGVSSCIIGLVNQEKITKAICFEEGELANIVIALGYSDIETRAKDRKDKDQVVKYL